MSSSATSLSLDNDDFEGDFSFDALSGSLVNELLIDFQDDADATDGGGGQDALPNGHARVPFDAARPLSAAVAGTPLFPEVDNLLSLFKDSNDLVNLGYTIDARIHNMKKDHAVHDSKRQKTLAESIAVRGDGPSATLDEDHVEKLWRMVQDLKELDTAWHENLTINPNTTEQRLYGLIMGHVSSDIFLFHRERNSRMLDQPEDDIEFIVKELRDKGSAFGVNLSIIDEEEDETDPIYTSDTNEKLSDIWEHIFILIELLEESRDFICGLPQGPIPANLEVIQSTEIEKNGSEADAKKVVGLKGLIDPKDGVNNREQILSDILCRLGERRRERSYAPPIGKELKCYQEIRKWIVSASYFSCAKSDWLLNWETRRTDYLRRSGEVECANYFAIEKLHIRSDDLGFDISHLFHAPSGHQIAVVFDELPEFRSLLSGWRKRFSDITTRFFEKKGELMNGINVTDGLDTLNIEVDGRERVRVEKEREVKKSGERLYAFDATEMAVRSFKPAAGNDRQMTKTRAQYLVDILMTFVRIRSSCSRSWLTSKEVRLYARILQHLNSSIWLFYSTGTPGERQQALESRKKYEERIGKKSHVLSRLFLPAPWRWEEKTQEQCLQEIVCLMEVIGSLSLSPPPTTEVIKTREQYLQEIVSLVEVIDSLFLCSVPSAEDMLVYETISWEYTSLDLLQSRCYLKKDIEGNTGTKHLTFSAKEVGALAKRVLKGTCAREVELAAELEKEFGDTLRTIFTKVPKETKVMEWLIDHKEAAVTDLKDLAMELPQRFEFLDHVLLSLQEANSLIGRILLGFMRANSVTQQAVNLEKQYEVPLKEGWAVLRVVEASNCFI